MKDLALLIAAWIVGSRLAGSIILYQLAWGKAWAPDQPGAKTWGLRALVSPEWAFWKYSKVEGDVAPIPVGNYCRKR